jgi:sensor histidine kinase YesM
LEIQKLRFNEHLLYTVDIQEDIESDFILVPPLLFQPFIENAIEHGISMRETPGKLYIKISEQNDSLEFLIEDDGPGFSQTENESSHISYSTTIFKERIQNLNLRLQKPIMFQIVDRSQISELLEGVSVKILLPIILKGKK